MLDFLNDDIVSIAGIEAHVVYLGSKIKSEDAADQSALISFAMCLMMRLR